MKTHVSVITLVAMATISSTSFVRAEVLVDFNLASVPSVAITSATATTVANGLTAGLLTRGPGLTAINLARGFSSQGWNNSGTTTTSRADAISGNKYYTFDLTIAAGSTASFSDISTSFYKSAISSPGSMEWQYSFDNYVTTGSTLVTFNHFGRNSGTLGTPTPLQWMSPPYNNGGGPLALDTPGQSNGNTTGAIDISTVSALQNIAGPATVSFRLYGWGSINGAATTPTNTLAIGRDNGPLINGSIVPEPASICLLAAAAGIGGVIRARRSRGT